MRCSIALLVAGCSLEGFATGASGEFTVGQGGAGAAGGSGGSCPACACSAWTETKLTELGPSMDPSIAWADDGWGVAWQDARDGNNELYFTRLEPRGGIAASLRVTNDPADTLLPNLLWNGTRYAIAYEDHRNGHADAYLAWVDAAGSNVTLDVRVCNISPGCDGTPRAPAVAWGRGSYAMVWEDYRDFSWELRRGLVSEAGEPGNVDVAVNGASGNEHMPAMVFGAFEHGVAWHDDRDGDMEIYFARLDGAAAKIGAESRVTNAPGESRIPSIAWTGSGYGLAWTDTRDGGDRVYFARLTEGGAVQDELLIGEGSSPSIAWDGEGYAIAWQNGSHIHFARIDAEGALLGSSAIVGANGTASQPSLAWSGSAYALAWQDDRDGSNAIFFASCDAR